LWIESFRVSVIYTCAGVCRILVLNTMSKHFLSEFGFFAKQSGRFAFCKMAITNCKRAFTIHF